MMIQIQLSCQCNILIIIYHMNKTIIVVLLAIYSTAALSPLILISPNHHSVISNSDNLIEYLNQKQSSLFVDLGQITEEQLEELKDLLKAESIPKERISSFYTSQHNVEKLKQELNKAEVQIKNLVASQILPFLKDQTKNIVVSASVTKTSPRLLQPTPAPFNNTKYSRMFVNMSTHSLSGLWVGLFLLVMIAIALNVLFNLKTHEKFARQNLWVGRQS